MSAGPKRTVPTTLTCSRLDTRYSSLTTYVTVAFVTGQVVGVVEGLPRCGGPMTWVPHTAVSRDVSILSHTCPEKPVQTCTGRFPGGSVMAFRNELNEAFTATDSGCVLLRDVTCR